MRLIWLSGLHMVLSAIFQYLPIRIVETLNSTRIYKNTHISGSTNATETCQTILESADHGLQLMLR